VRRKVLVIRISRMAIYIEVSTTTISSKAKDSTSGKTLPNIKESSAMEKEMATEYGNPQAIQILKFMKERT
jgi:hypothetical protein